MVFNSLSSGYSQASSFSFIYMSKDFSRNRFFHTSGPINRTNWRSTLNEGFSVELPDRKLSIMDPGFFRGKCPVICFKAVTLRKRRPSKMPPVVCSVASPKRRAKQRKPCCR